MGWSAPSSEGVHMRRTQWFARAHRTPAALVVANRLYPNARLGAEFSNCSLAIRHGASPIAIPCTLSARRPLKRLRYEGPKQRPESKSGTTMTIINDTQQHGYAPMNG